MEWVRVMRGRGRGILGYKLVKILDPKSVERQEEAQAPMKQIPETGLPEDVDESNQATGKIEEFKVDHIDGTWDLNKVIKDEEPDTGSANVNSKLGLPSIEEDDTNDQGSLKGSKNKSETDGAKIQTSSMSPEPKRSSDHDKDARRKKSHINPKLPVNCKQTTDASSTPLVPLTNGWALPEDDPVLPKPKKIVTAPTRSITHSSSRGFTASNYLNTIPALNEEYKVKPQIIEPEIGFFDANPSKFDSTDGVSLPGAEHGIEKTLKLLGRGAPMYCSSNSYDPKIFPTIGGLDEKRGEHGTRVVTFQLGMNSPLITRVRTTDNVLLFVEETTRPEPEIFANPAQVQKPTITTFSLEPPQVHFGQDQNGEPGNLYNIVEEDEVDFDFFGRPKSQKGAEKIKKSYQASLNYLPRLEESSGAKPQPENKQNPTPSCSKSVAGRNQVSSNWDRVTSRRRSPRNGRH